MKGIALIGFMGSGKSTVGPILAEELELAFVDLDDVAAGLASATVGEIFAADGEAGWRRWESLALRKVVERNPVVLACGGGVVLKPENRDTLRREFLTIYLKTSEAVLVGRLKNASGRPLLEVADQEQAVARLLEERRDIYEASAHAILSTDGKKPRTVAAEAAALAAKVGKSGPEM